MYKRSRMWDKVERPYNGSTLSLEVTLTPKDLEILEAMVRLGVMRAFEDGRYKAVDYLKNLATQLQHEVERIDDWENEGLDNG